MDYSQYMNVGVTNIEGLWVWSVHECGSGQYIGIASVANICLWGVTNMKYGWDQYMFVGCD